MSRHPSSRHHLQYHPFFPSPPFGYQPLTATPPRVYGYGYRIPSPPPSPPPRHFTLYSHMNEPQAAEDEHDVDDYEDGDDDDDNDNDNDEEYHNIDEDDDDDEEGDTHIYEYLRRASNPPSRSHLPTAHSGGAADNQLPFPSQPPTAMPSANSRKRRASSATAEAALSSTTTRKRRRAQEANLTDTNPLTYVDLSGDQVDPNAHDPIQATLQKQREEQVRAQQPAVPSGKSKLTTIQCTVCLEPPTDLTATACGHVFCRACLNDWLRSAERDPNRRPNCPACRKQLRHFRNTRQKDLVNLVFMKKST